MSDPRNRLAGAPQEGAQTWDDGEVTQRFGDPGGSAPDPAAADDEPTAVLRAPGPVPSPRAHTAGGGAADEETTVLPAQDPDDGEPTAVLPSAREAVTPPPEVETPASKQAHPAVEEKAAADPVAGNGEPADVPAGAGAAGPERAAEAEGVAGPEAESEGADPEGEAPAGEAADGEAGTPAVSADLAEPIAGKRPRRGKRRAVRERLTRRSAVVALLCAILGFALAAQLRANDAGDAKFANLRQSDLVQILDELDSREKRLRSEISDLEFRRQNLTSANQGSENAVADAEKRAAELGILAGTVTAEGPGVVITLKEKKDKPLLADRLVDAVQELRGAGAEALQIGGSTGDPVRIVASTYFTDAAGGISVDGHVLAAPYSVTAIGDPQTIDRAMRIPGGVVATIRQDEAQIQIDQRRTVQITAIRAPRAPRFAKPVK
ncbi:MAG: hypothetical protein JWO79_3159 [Actinomycetia bacterium]|nr:hypothetical protein [Actinomycetes bacterium]